MVNASSRAWVVLAALPLVAIPARADADPDPGQRVPIPIAALFANPRLESPRLSPDGMRFAALHQQGDFQSVVVKPLDRTPGTTILRFDDPAFRLRWVEWKTDERLLLAGESRDPRSVGVRGRMTRLYGVDASGANLRWLGKRWGRWLEFEFPAQFEDEIVHWLPSDPAHVLIALEGRVWKLDVRSGLLALERERALGVGEWRADTEGAIRVGEGRVRDEYELRARAAPDGAFEKVSHHDLLTGGGPRFAGFHRNPGRLYVSAPDAGHVALFEFDIASKQLGALVFAHPDVDVDGLVLGPPPAMHAIGVSYTVDRHEIHFIDDTAREERARLVQAIGLGPLVTLARVSASDDGNREILIASSDVTAPRYYLFDRKQRTVGPLFAVHPQVPAAAMASARRFSFTTRDGVELAAYLTLPLGTQTQRFPAIVLAHGGPSDRDAIEWNPEVQLFASRGFAVLQVNFRGSSGYGRAFEEAGHREWGGLMQNDITDGVAWMVARGIADPERIGIYGSSYGGYAALMGLVATPSLYRAGAAYAGVTDLPSMLQDDRWYGGALDRSNRRSVGGGWSDRRRLRGASPRRRADEIAAPVLLGHGEDDDTVSVRHSRDMASALRDAGKPVEYLEFPHEIHGFLLEANRVKWYEALIAFFEKNLAPREQPAAAAP
jgi:dipeptidyl aminopeptidase/acylaminoacyl peptidase